MLGGLEDGGWYLNGKEAELDASGDVGIDDHDMTSAKKSALGPRDILLTSTAFFADGGAANASALETL